MRPCRNTMQGRLGPSPRKNCRHALLYAEEFPGCILAPSEPRAEAGAGILPFLRVESQSPQPGLQAGESATPSVFGASEYRLSRPWESGRGDIVWFWIGSHGEYDRLLRRV